MEVQERIRRLFIESGRVLTLKKGDFVYRQGDRAESLYWVEQGLVGLSILAPSGHDYLLRFFKPGDFFGHRALFSEPEKAAQIEPSFGPYHATSRALEPCRIRSLQVQDFFEWLNQNPKGLGFFLGLVCSELGRAERERVSVLEHEVLPRVAMALVYLKDIHPDRSWTRQEIANFCSSTETTVIKVMAELERRELIKQEGRQFLLKDRDALVQLATPI